MAQNLLFVPAGKARVRPNPRGSRINQAAVLRPWGPGTVLTLDQLYPGYDLEDQKNMARRDVARRKLGIIPQPGKATYRDLQEMKKAGVPTKVLAERGFVFDAQKEDMRRLAEAQAAERAEFDRQQDTNTNVHEVSNKPKFEEAALRQMDEESLRGLYKAEFPDKALRSGDAIDAMDGNELIADLLTRMDMKVVRDGVSEQSGPNFLT